MILDVEAYVASTFTCDRLAMFSDMRPRHYRPARSRPPSIIEETLVSTTVLDQAMRALIGQVRVDCRHDVPYLAGSSRDGRTVYLDRHMPRLIMIGRKRVPVDAYVVLHEVIEKLLFDRFRLTYPHAHQFALRLEQAAVRNAGISWHDYNALMQANVKRAHDERLKRLPPDLEIKPYRDEDEVALLRHKQKHRPRLPG